MAELTVPTINFAPLGQLGNVYRQAQNDQLRQQTLQNLGQGGTADAAALIRSGDMSLAQLGISMQNRQADMERQARQDAFQREEAQRAQRNADRSYGLQARSQGRLEAAAEADSPSGRAKVIREYGLEPTSEQGRSFILTGKLPEANTTIASQTAQRQQAAAALGLTPDNPGYQSFVLTGKMPREDAQPLTAGDKEAIRTADDAVISNRAAIDSLNRAKQLSKQAFAGPGAGYAGAAASYLGETSDLGKRGIATENLTNEVMTNALGQLKAIFGGNPTEGERRILLDLQGSASKPDSVRQAIFDRAKAAAEKRLEFNQKRADELRGNTYYKPKNVQPGETAGTTVVEAPKIGQLQQGYRFKGGDPADPNSWVKQQ